MYSSTKTFLLQDVAPDANMYATANELKRKEWLRELGQSCDQSCDHLLDVERQTGLLLLASTSLLQNVAISDFLCVAICMKL